MTQSGSTSKRGYSKARSIGLNSSTDIIGCFTMDVNGSSVRLKPSALENPVNSSSGKVYGLENP